ncbi:MAG: hypothetical protein KIS69_12560, partial [Bacteroidetes bacterium]|nr:hypothetical protein [Bacteroidota bacterium]
MKSSNCIYLLIFAIMFSSCKNRENIQHTANYYLYKTIQSAHVDSKAKTLIHVINPGDCLTCIAFGKNWFRMLNKDSAKDVNVVFVLQEMSDLQMNDLFKERLPEDAFVSVDSLHIIRNNEIYNHLQDSFNSGDKYSFLLIVDKDSTLLFDKKFKDAT